MIADHTIVQYAYVWRDGPRDDQPETISNPYSDEAEARADAASFSERYNLKTRILRVTTTMTFEAMMP